MTRGGATTLPVPWWADAKLLTLGPAMGQPQVPPVERRASSPLRAVVAGTVSAVAIALMWCWAYGIGSGTPVAFASLVGAHAVAGGVLAGALHATTRRFADPARASGLAALLAAGGVPAALAFAPTGSWSAAQLVLVIAAGSGLAIVLAVLVARAGRGASALVAGGLIVAFASLAAQPSATALAPHRVAPVEIVDPLVERLAVIGLDSADWRVIDPMLARGELPNLAGLIARGRSAVLLSTEPSDSPVVWTTIFSGRPPSEHGIVDWESAHAANRRTALLWEMLAGAGQPSLVVNVPGTWPPTGVAGAMIAGFPIPSALRWPDRTQIQNLGSIVSMGARPGPLHTAIASPRDDGRQLAHVDLGAVVPTPRSGLRDPLIDRVIDAGWLKLPDVGVDVLVSRGDAATGDMTVQLGEHRFALAPSAWSEWLRVDTIAGPIHLRVRRLDDDALWITPAFQDPAAPIHPWADSRATRERIAHRGLYVVEPAGWRSVDDASLRDALVEHLIDVEEQHLAALTNLLESVPGWRLLAHVITLPDRTSHAFWRYHEPGAYPPLPADELAAHRSKVEDAYRESDRLLGQILERIGSGTTLLVVSDHGSAAGPPPYGTHRREGILIAAGPGIAPTPEREQLEIDDVTPLALALLGLPLADDLHGEVPAAVFAQPGSGARIESYETEEAVTTAAGSGVTIDESTRDQLRGLGYLE